MSAHTPTPWYTGEGKAARIVYAQHGFAVADATIYHARIEPVMEAEENAAFIVRACNAHDDLVAALQAAVARVEIANAEGDPIMSAWLPDARAALAKAVA